MRILLSKGMISKEMDNEDNERFADEKQMKISRSLAAVQQAFQFNEQDGLLSWASEGLI